MAAAYLERMGERMRERREELGLSRPDVARAMPGKTNENAIYRWEKGLHRPNDDALEALARVLDVDPAFFLADQPRNGNGDLMGTIATALGPSDASIRLEAIEATQVAILDRLEALAEELGALRNDMRTRRAS